MTSNAHRFAGLVDDAHHRHLNSKLNRQCRKSSWCRFSNSDNISNLRTTTLNENEKKVFGLGLSFNLNSVKKNTIATPPTVDEFFRNNRKSIANLDLVRAIILPSLLVPINTEARVLSKRLNKALTDLRKNDSIKIMPGDKGGKVVVLDTDDYKRKAFNLINDNEFYEKLTFNPLESINSYVRSKLNRFTKSCADRTIFQKFATINPSLSHFYGLPKHHKPGCP